MFDNLETFCPYGTQPSFRYLQFRLLSLVMQAEKCVYETYIRHALVKIIVNKVLLYMTRVYNVNED